jgi:hypothetical protein
VERLRGTYDTDAAGYVRYFGRYRGTFSEPFLLQRFPFDRHHVEIRITSTWPVQALRYTNYEGYANTVESFALAAWRLPPDPLDVEIVPLPEQSAASRYVFSRTHIRCKVQRAHMYYFWNAFFPFFLICLLTLASFLFDVDDLANRLQVSLTLLLTAVAFKFVMQSSLPQIEYLTVLDKYTLAGIGFIFAVSAEDAVVKTLVLTLGNADVAQQVDLIALYVFGGIVVVSHTVLGGILLFNPPWLFQPWSKLQTAF